MSFNPRNGQQMKTDERSPLGLGAKESMENKYEDFPEERAL